MSRDNDTIRRIVAELDQQIAALKIVARIPGIGPEVMFSIQRMEESRFWLKQIGHAGHFDTPEGDTP